MSVLSSIGFMVLGGTMVLMIMALLSINDREQTSWTPVSEGLPEDGTWSLFTDGKTVSVERYKSDAIDHFFPNGRWFSLEESTAWMPLPEPYKAESEE